MMVERCYAMLYLVMVMLSFVFNENWYIGLFFLVSVFIAFKSLTLGALLLIIGRGSFYFIKQKNYSEAIGKAGIYLAAPVFYILPGICFLYLLLNAIFEFE